MDRIVGQSHAIELLQASLAGGRLHHAYVFHGPTGVGKFTTARAFAKVLLCHDAQPDLTGRIAACESCEACRLFEAGTHPDLHIVTKELARYSDDRTIRDRKLLTIPLQVLRSELIEPVNLAPRAGKRKLFIVDEAELLAPQGQNALLKTLEEPPPGTHLILVTSSEDKLLMTIRSRCQRIAFTVLDDEQVRAWLTEYVDADAPLDWFVRYAAGSIGQAKLAIDYDLAAWGKAVDPALDNLAKGNYPTDLGATLAGLINGFAEQWVADHDNASKEAANKQAAGLMWKLIGQWAHRNIVKISERCDPADPVAAERALEPYLGVIDSLREAESEMAANVNMGLVTDHLVSMLARALRGEPVTVRS